MLNEVTNSYFSGDTINIQFFLLLKFNLCSKFVSNFYKFKRNIFEYIKLIFKLPSVKGIYKQYYVRLSYFLIYILTCHCCLKLNFNPSTYTLHYISNLLLTST